MKIAVIVLSALVVILMALVGVLWFERSSLNTGVSQPGIIQFNRNTNENSQLIGGQKDKYGCLIGAGYSWCETKNKCLRTWEEECQAQNQKAGKGFIEGSLGYPSEGIPEMNICAENVSTKVLTCTSKKINNRKYTYGEGYRLEVPTGTYYVFATLLPAGAGGSAFANYKAYYSEFVTCGIDANCPSHAPVKVVVHVNQTVPQIDPIDWYNVQN